MPNSTQNTIFAEGVTVAGALLGIVIWLHIAGAFVSGDPFSSDLFSASLVYASASSLVFLLYTLFCSQGFSALNAARNAAENSHVLIRKAALKVLLHAMAYANGVAFSCLIATAAHLLFFDFDAREVWTAAILNTVIFGFVYLATKEFKISEILAYPIRSLLVLICAAIVFRFILFNIWEL